MSLIINRDSKCEISSGFCVKCSPLRTNGVSVVYVFCCLARVVDILLTNMRLYLGYVRLWPFITFLTVKFVVCPLNDLGDF